LHKSAFAVVSDKTNAEIFIEAVRLGKKVLRQGIFEMALNVRGNIPLPSGNREFLLDCLEFALNGERELSIESRHYFIEYYEQVPKVTEFLSGKSDRADRLLAQLNNTRDDKRELALVTRWLQQPNGLRDLLGSLAVLAGSPSGQ
jgi:hypothetical protein